MRECLHVAGAGRLYSEASNVPHVTRGRVSKVFVLITYTIYIIGILSAGPHVAVRSLFPAEMNVPHVARCGSAELQMVLPMKIHTTVFHLRGATRCEQRAVHCLAMRTNTLLRRIRMNTKKAMIEVNQSSLCVGVPGLEPGKTGPESVVLPITPYPKLSV